MTPPDSPSRPPRRPRCPMPEKPWPCQLQWTTGRDGHDRSVACLDCGKVGAIPADAPTPDPEGRSDG